MPVPVMVVIVLMMPVFVAVVAVMAGAVAAVTVMVVMVVVVTVFMAIVTVAAAGAGRFVFVTGQVIRPFPQVHYGVGAGDAPPFVLFKAEFPTRNAEFFQFRPQGGGVHPQIHQGAKTHIAGDAGPAVKMQRFHGFHTIPL
jgi:hypothetical protein